MATLKSLFNSAKKIAIGGPQVSAPDLFPKTDPEIDGEACTHDCESCSVKYPRGFKIEESDELYGSAAAWGTHVLVATGKTDWKHDVQDEKGSVMEGFGKAASPSNGKLKLSASNMPTPHGTTDYSLPTKVLLLPAFVMVDNVTPQNVPSLVDLINLAPTNKSPLEPVRLSTTAHQPQHQHKHRRRSSASGKGETALSPLPQLTHRSCPHRVLILLCSQKTRDARCGQSAPLLRKELERHLRPLGLFRDLDDDRPGGVGIYFISHVGGHKYSANVIIYRRPDPFGLDGVERANVQGELKPRTDNKKETNGEGNGSSGEPDTADVGAAQCIWLARVKPQDCENLVRYTVLQGKVVKPETQLRGGFDRERGLSSW